MAGNDSWIAPQVFSENDVGGSFGTIRLSGSTARGARVCRREDAARLR
jgi:hypothetical protein